MNRGIALFAAAMVLTFTVIVQGSEPMVYTFSGTGYDTLYVPTSNGVQRYGLVDPDVPSYYEYGGLYWTGLGVIDNNNSFAKLGGTVGVNGFGKLSQSTFDNPSGYSVLDPFSATNNVGYNDFGLTLTITAPEGMLFNFLGGEFIPVHYTEGKLTVSIMNIDGITVARTIDISHTPSGGDYFYTPDDIFGSKYAMLFEELISISFVMEYAQDTLAYSGLYVPNNHNVLAFDNLVFEIYENDLMNGSMVYQQNSMVYQQNVYDVVAPEPATLLAIGFGMLGLACVRRKIGRSDN